MKDQLRTLDFRLRDPVRIFKLWKTISFHHNLQVENGHLFRLKTFTDRVVEARKVEEGIDPDLFKNLNNSKWKLYRSGWKQELALAEIKKPGSHPGCHQQSPFSSIPS